MSDPTKRGRFIADQIRDDDPLTLGDIWLILDQLIMHFMDIEKDYAFLEKWMKEIKIMDEDLP